jgi:hypothetical protein
MLADMGKDRPLFLNVVRDNEPQGYLNKTLYSYQVSLRA